MIVPSGLAVRPMRGRIRESLFSIIGDEIRGAKFLDGFAGSGAIGLEAISRGAAEVLFVERDSKVLTVLRRNISEVSVEARTRIVAADLYESLAAAPNPFDWIFLDPPFRDYEGTGDSPWQLAFRLAGSGRSQRHSRMSGWMPMARSSRTECWVGFVLSSPAVPMYGTRVR